MGGGGAHMSYRIGPTCDGCGICVMACPRGAIRVSDDGAIPYAVVSLDCNDCGKCAIVCPPSAIDVDPAWAVCRARGCPLSSERFSEWSCTEGRRRCPTCGNALWINAELDRWVCIHCELGSKVVCPKVRKAAAVRPGADLASS